MLSQNLPPFELAGFLPINPRKGTETHILDYLVRNPERFLPINPRKGTETETYRVIAKGGRLEAFPTDKSP